MGVPRSRCSTRGVTMPSVCPTPFNISNAYPTYFISCLHPILAPCPTATPSKPPHRDHRDSVPVSPTSSLLPAPSTSTPSTLPWPPVPASSSPLTSTWGFHVADAAHRGVTMPSVCPTPFNISNAYPLPAPSSPRSRCSTPSCPLLTLGIPHSRCSTPRCPRCATTHASPCLLSAPHLFCLPSWGRRHWAAALK